jgi:hypothetical protein
MARYLVTTRRAERGSSVSAREAVESEPGITLLTWDDPQTVMIEANEQQAENLRLKFNATHIVEPEFHRSLH